ncbi:MAG: hypothetical protein NTV49_05855 [Kiritimatiellaeota bacterium]|nr:hypothetical protein [Kiritimatiellota bacterium]
MEEKTALSPELAATLKRYLELQQEEQRLREEKTVLQEKLANHMAGLRLTYWYPELEGQPLKVRCTETTVVEYDETTLKARLGPRYAAVLAPDPRKIRRHLPELSATLAPVMDLIGSPTADRVKTAIAQGLVSTEDFAGAFTKTTKRLVAVAKAKPGGAVQNTP